LEAPLVRVHPTSGAWHQKLLARLVRWLPKLQIPGAKLKRHLLTRNETLMARWDRDELMARADMYVNTGNALLDGTEYIESILPDIQWPFMIATGDDDIACDYEGAIHFYNTASSKDKGLKVYPSLRHALKFEPESDKVMNDLVEWFGKFVKK
jgi:alpha-beta hydrolase superfamily lysophospholipase